MLNICFVTCCFLDQKKYSFALQVYLLNKRFKQQQQIIWQGKGGVQDRTIYEDSVFGMCNYNTRCLLGLSSNVLLFVFVSFSYYVEEFGSDGGKRLQNLLGIVCQYEQLYETSQLDYPSGCQTGRQHATSHG